MTVEEVKSNLKQVKYLKIRLMALKQRIKELEEEIDGVAAVDYSGVKVKVTKGNSVENRCIRRADRLKVLQTQYEDIFGELCAVEDELGERMKRLNPTEYEVINLRYIKGLHTMSINKVANKLGYVYESVQKIQQRAFKKMADEEG